MGGWAGEEEEGEGVGGRVGVGWWVVSGEWWVVSVGGCGEGGGRGGGRKGGGVAWTCRVYLPGTGNQTHFNLGALLLLFLGFWIWGFRNRINLARLVREKELASLCPRGWVVQVTVFFWTGWSVAMSDGVWVTLVWSVSLAAHLTGNPSAPAHTPRLSFRSRAL